MKIKVAPAVARAAMETGVARKTINIEEYREQLAYRQGRGEQVRYFFQNKARTSGGKKRVVFAEGEEQKIIRAAYQLKEEGIATPILIGNPVTIQQHLDNLGLSSKPEIVDNSNFKLASQYATAYSELRNRKGLTMMDAVKKIREPNVLGPMMVKCGDADAFISGLTYDYPDVPTPMPSSELYTSLQTGVVDAGENDPASVVSWGWVDVIKFYSLNEHSISCNVMMMNKKKMDGLPADVQQAIREAGKKAANYQLDYIQKALAENLEKIKAKGVKVNVITDKKPFQDAVKDIIAKYEPEIGKDLIQAVRDAAKK